MSSSVEPARKTTRSSVGSSSDTSQPQRPRSASVEALLAAAAITQRKDSGGSSTGLLLDQLFGNGEPLFTTTTTQPATATEEQPLLGRVRLDSTTFTTHSSSHNNSNNEVAEQQQQRTQRLESWGGMSDLSGFMNENSTTPRSRLNSLAWDTTHETTTTTATTDSAIQEAVTAMGDVLEELAGAVENAVEDFGFFGNNNNGSGSHESSNSQKQQSKDTATEDEATGNTPTERRRPRSHSTASSTGRLSVDLDAIQAALDAGEAAETMGLVELAAAQGALFLENPNNQNSGDSSTTHTTTLRFAKRTGLPLKRKVESSHSSEPPKKRASIPATVKTPKISNATKKRKLAPTPCTSSSSTPKTTSKKSTATPSSSTTSADQKWETMYTALSQFAQEQPGPWNGNVPTHYVTPQPQQLKLGRWVNNQRTAHQKGTLKPHRAERLVATGLKWNVIPANSWHAMYKELQHYIQVQEKESGAPWNGNVPTHYQVTTSANSEFAGQDKNLGRWINRQRSAYTAGKLKPERQQALEDIGLRWSMTGSASTTTESWNTMVQALQEYATSKGATWDGTVPLQYKKDQLPLGRWVAKQRKAPQKLTPEQVQVLTRMGILLTTPTPSTPSATPVTATSAPVTATFAPATSSPATLQPPVCPSATTTRADIVERACQEVAAQALFVANEQPVESDSPLVATKNHVQPEETKSGATAILPGKAAAKEEPKSEPSNKCHAKNGVANPVLLLGTETNNAVVQPEKAASGVTASSLGEETVEIPAETKSDPSNECHSKTGADIPGLHLCTERAAKKSSVQQEKTKSGATSGPAAKIPEKTQSDPPSLLGPTSV